MQQDSTLTLGAQFNEPNNIFDSASPDYMTVEGIRLDPDNEKFFQAAAFVLQTDRIIFLTGKAGTGKTTFLKYIRQFQPENTIVLAPTGVAAINARGQTIHSFFKLAFTPYPYNDARIYSREIYEHLRYTQDKISIIRDMALLIIDEISMVRCDVLDVIDHILRVFRKQPHLPFGGVQVLLMGDPYQLPPVVMDSDWEILKQDYQGKYFFDSKIYQAINPLYIELEKPYRQTEEEFINLLNKIRINELSQEELTSLNNKVNNILPTQGCITVGSTNRIVNDHNLSKLHKLPNELITFEGTTTGTFPESMMVAEQRLQLKIGAQVMILKNKWLDEFRGFEYYNGSIGIIQDIQQDSPRITIKLTDKSDRIVHIDPVTWQNIEYESVKDESDYTKIQAVTIGTYTQFPLKLAWAITIHKSQGLSFESIIADIGWTQPGLVYVALSRCRKLSGLFLKSKISMESLKVDSRIAAFVKSKIPDSIIIKELEAGKANRLYKEAWEEFDKGDFNAAYASFYAAVKIRDDRETPIMKTTLAKRYKQLLRHQRQRMQWLQKFKLTLRENQKLNNQIAENNTTHCAEQKTITLLKNTIITKDEEIKINKSQIKELQEVIQQKITEISKLNTHVQELEISLEEQKQTIQELCATIQNQTSNLKSQTSRIFDMQRKITQKQQKITDYEAIMRRQSQEIERLQALTWYQKLFGKKVK
ncbi:ATP-dependent DNA helicase [Alistipes indistinctus]|uniref:ATP-dependent DNA helicase n=1 Tax=Alistipes indistinctus TaxID=626932 RepID=UPI0035207BCE